MERLGFLRLIYRSTCFRSARFSAMGEQQQLCNGFRHYSSPSSSQLLRTFFSLSPASVSTYSRRISPEFGPSFTMGLGSRRAFSEDVTHLPTITDPELRSVFKDLMAMSWDNLPHAVIHDAKNALSKNTEDKIGKEILTNVFRAAVASEHFSGVLVSLRMEIDDSIGLSGENVRPLPNELADALRAAYERYTTYLDAFGPDETYLRKKVETELGTKMIHLKMRCSGLGSEWGKVTVLGTSGLSGSYVEHRAP
ncbi:Protein of unknown function DUF4370 [Macleaya cordata]|uniref:Succinate dehydrogenase subunit 5, mitochondrial n=1 Tax=Macleaya cordata TaxID=56857 RepID=A0A200QZ86_MACCD|nr:Protein of unknown function DUF4370 [Macleaya cordata]